MPLIGFDGTAILATRKMHFIGFLQLNTFHIIFALLRIHFCFGSQHPDTLSMALSETRLNGFKGRTSFALKFILLSVLILIRIKFFVHKIRFLVFIHFLIEFVKFITSNANRFIAEDTDGLLILFFGLKILNATIENVTSLDEFLLVFLDTYFDRILEVLLRGFGHLGMFWFVGIAILLPFYHNVISFPFRFVLVGMGICFIRVFYSLVVFF